MLERERLESKKISKTNAVTSMLDYEMDPDNVHVGPSDHVPWLQDRKWCYIRMEGTTFGDVPLNAELKLEVWDSPNSAGVITDAIRCLKLGLDRGLKGTLVAPSSYFMKSPPLQIHDDIAINRVEAFIRGEDNETLVGTETPDEARSSGSWPADAPARPRRRRRRPREGGGRRVSPAPTAAAGPRSAPRSSGAPAARLRGSSRSSRSTATRAATWLVAHVPVPARPLGDRDRLAGRLPPLADEARAGRTRTSATSSACRRTIREVRRLALARLPRVRPLPRRADAPRDAVGARRPASEVVQADLDHIEEAWRGSQGRPDLRPRPRRQQRGRRGGASPAAAGRSTSSPTTRRFPSCSSASAACARRGASTSSRGATCARSTPSSGGARCSPCSIDWGYRPDGIPVRLFGAWTTLPAGRRRSPRRPARAILPVAIRRDAGRPLPRLVRAGRSGRLGRAGRAPAGDPGRSPTRSAATIAAAPEQWYSFKPMWPSTAEEAAELERARRRCSRRRPRRRGRRRPQATTARSGRAAARPIAGRDATGATVGRRPTARRRAEATRGRAAGTLGQRIRARLLVGRVVARLPAAGGPAARPRRARRARSAYRLAAGARGPRPAQPRAASSRWLADDAAWPTPRSRAAATRPARARAARPRGVPPPRPLLPRDPARARPRRPRSSTSGSSSRTRTSSTRRSPATRPAIFVGVPLGPIELPGALPRPALRPAGSSRRWRRSATRRSRPGSSGRAAASGVRIVGLREARRELLGGAASAASRSGSSPTATSPAAASRCRSSARRRRCRSARRSSRSRPASPLYVVGVWRDRHGRLPRPARRGPGPRRGHAARARSTATLDARGARLRAA